MGRGGGRREIEREKKRKKLMVQTRFRDPEKKWVSGIQNTSGLQQG